MGQPTKHTAAIRGRGRHEIGESQDEIGECNGGPISPCNGPYCQVNQWASSAHDHIRNG
jgi:hypothetical protein